MELFFVCQNFRSNGWRILIFCTQIDTTKKRTPQKEEADNNLTFWMGVLSHVHAYINFGKIRMGGT